MLNILLPGAVRGAQAVALAEQFVAQGALFVLALEQAARLQFRHQFEDGFPLYIGIMRGGSVIHLSQHEGDAPGPALVYLLRPTWQP